ncbi:hypothetical protein ACGTN9_11290 [Halobacillus sp. MO56]
MKKSVIGIVLIIIILGFTLVFANNSGEPANAKSDERIKSELRKSMEETKNEKEKIEKLFTKSSKALKDEGFGEVGLSYSNEERIFTVQVYDKDLLEDNKVHMENIIVNTAKEVGFNDFDITFTVVNRNVTQNK